MQSEGSLTGKFGRITALVVVAIMLMAATAIPVFGQGQIDSEGYAAGMVSIQGTVLDNVTDTAPSEQITIELHNSSTGALEDSFQTHTDGTYSSSGVSDGNYNISFRDPAFNYTTFVVHERDIMTGKTYFLNVSLDPVSSTVSGTVYDDLSGEVLENARVTLTEIELGSEQVAFTDDNGEYEFSTKTRHYTLEIAKNGYLPYTETTPHLLEINSTVNDTFDLARGTVTVSGTVTGSGPLAGASVTLSGLMDYSTTTNMTGEYSMEVYWGDYEMDVHKAGYFLSREAITVLPGIALEKNVDLQKTPTQNAQVFGFVKENGTSLPIQDAEVCFIDEEQDGMLCMETGVDGYFHFTIYPAYFKLKIGAEGYIGHTSYVSIGKDENRNLGDVLLTPTPPMDNRLHGTVTSASGGTGIANAQLTFSDDGVEVVSTKTGMTGHYEIMVYEGTFEATLEAADHFPETVTGIEVSGDTERDFEMVEIPATGSRVFGYVKDAEDNPVGGASVEMVDMIADHGGYTMSTQTTPGGYYIFDSYDGDFLLKVDADGYDACLMELEVQGDKNQDLVLDQSGQQSVETDVEFENWQNISMEEVWEISNDVRLVRYDIDSKYGDNDGNVTAMEVDAWVQVLEDKGPEAKDTGDMIHVDGLAYGMVEGTYMVEAQGAAGEITSTDTITLTTMADYTAMDTVPEAGNHTITYNATFDTDYVDRGAVITLPEGWESRNATSEYVTISGTFDVSLDPPMKEEGLTYEHVLLNATGNSPPVAEAGRNRTVKVDVNETFDASGSEDDFGIMNYTWDFGDGETDYGEEVVHSFSLPAGEDFYNYTVNLTVRDTAGVTAHGTIWVLVDGGPPVARFDSNKTMADEDGDHIEFNASGASDNVGIVNYTWDFDDGTFGYGEAVNHSWTQPGQYNVSLNVTDEAGWWSTKNETVTIRDISDPVARIDYDGPEMNLFIEDEDELVFNGSTSMDNVGVVNYEWDLGDGTVIKGEDEVEINHTYTEVGEYNVTLTVWDEAGNSNTSDPLMFDVREKPKIPDLEIDSLKVEPDGFRDGDEVTIKVKLINNGDGAIGPGNVNEDFSIQFSYGDHKIKIKRDITIDAHSTETVKITWKAKEGNYKICAEVDPGNKIGETDENNNKKCTKKFEVGMGWQNIGIIVALVAVLIALVAVGIWRSKVAKKERKERLRKRKKR